MNIELNLADNTIEINLAAEALRDLGDVELALVGGGDVVVVGL